ncbi:hypothetical protein GE09DRAFT_1286388 [Coniochaeta sp. 2T2.1]|nr:hypothetical protein GE09DRAFT_1286388 [Coniochaeta sp. 2T2.1]
MPSPTSFGTAKRGVKRVCETLSDDDQPSDKRVDYGHHSDSDSDNNANRSVEIPNDTDDGISHSDNIESDRDDGDTGLPNIDSDDNDHTHSHKSGAQNFVVVDSDSSSVSEAYALRDGVGDSDDNSDNEKTILEFCKRKGYIPDDLVKTNYRWLSLLTYVGGKLATTPCAKCSRRSSRWAQCIVAPNAETAAAMHGCCAACVYAHHYGECSMFEAAIPSSSRNKTSGNDTGLGAGTFDTALPANPTRSELQEELDRTNAKLRVLKTERTEAKRELKDLVVQLRESLNRPAQLDTADLDRQLVDTGARRGRLLLESLAMTRRQKALISRLAESD